MTILKLENITLSLSRNSKPILEDINYQVKPGDFVILLGSNGSGKSSLLKLLYRHYQANTGAIHFLGKSIAHHGKEFNEYVAVLTQNCADSLFTTLTVYENYLMTTRHTKNTPASEKFLRAYLADYNSNLADKFHLPVSQLSGGEKQALALALCLLHPPTLLLLDEHTSALDPKTSEQIMQLTHKMILQHQITCILTTHDLDIALKYGNRVLMLQQGKILQTFDQHDKPTLTKEKLVSHYF